MSISKLYTVQQWSYIIKSALHLIGILGPFVVNLMRCWFLFGSTKRQLTRMEQKSNFDI